MHLFRLKVCFTAVIMMILLAGLAGCRGSAEKQARRQLALGERYLDETKYEEAIIAFNKVIDIEPNSLQAYHGLAQAYVGNGQPKEAVQQLKYGIECYDDMNDRDKTELLDEIYDAMREEIIKQLYSLAEDSRESEKYKRAQRYYKEILEYDSGDEDAYIGQAECYEEQGKTEEAAEILEDALEEIDSEAIRLKKEELEKKAAENNGDRKGEVTYQWVVEPVIEAEEIEVIRHSRKQYDDYGPSHFYGKLSKIKRDGKWSVIDYEGNILTPFQFRNVDVGYDYTYVLDPIDPREKYAYIPVTDYSLHYADYEEADSFIGSNGDPYVLWDADDNVPRLDGDLIEEERIEIELKYPEMVVAKRFTGPEEWDYEYSDKLALANRNGLVTDFIYDSCGSAFSGVIPVKKDGLWGYINEAGETIIPFKLKPYWKMYPYGESWAKPENMKVYSASDGYIPIPENGKWAYFDTTGNQVTDYVFEEARPPYQGKAWVKSEGKWGVIQLSPYEETLPSY